MTCQGDIHHPKLAIGASQSGFFAENSKKCCEPWGRRSKSVTSWILRDVSLMPALSLQKGGGGEGKAKRGQGTKLVAMADGAGLPIAIPIGSASRHEVRLVETTLKARITKVQPKRLIGARAHDSDPLDEQLRQQGIQMIAPHKVNRKKAGTRDGRPLRRYRRRRKIERLFAWLQNFRGIQVRHDRILENYLGFVLLGCMIIFLRSYF